MSYRSDVDALTSRHNALDAEVQRVQKERDAVRTMLDSANARLRLPVLDHIRVASPCAETWEAMPGDAQVRHCGRCNQNVYNLSELTRDEAESLLIEKEGRLCIRYYRRPKDGTILTRDCPVGAQRRRRWMFGIGMIMTLLGAVFGFLSLRKKAAPQHDHLMGIVPAQDAEVTMGGSGASYPEQMPAQPTHAPVR